MDDLYYRTINTYLELNDFHESIKTKPFEELSHREQEYAKKLIELCGKISNEFDYLITD